LPPKNLISTQLKNPISSPTARNPPAGKIIINNGLPEMRE
jgi:hypothetical protein